MEKFEFLEHTADVKFRAFGSSMEEVYLNSALALKKTLIDDEVEGKIEKKIKVEGKDWEALMYNFLEEFLVLLDSESFLISSVKNLKIHENGDKGYLLEGIVVGDKSENYEIHTHVKAITYNSMVVEKVTTGEWIAEVVMDV